MQRCFTQSIGLDLVGSGFGTFFILLYMLPLVFPKTLHTERYLAILLFNFIIVQFFVHLLQVLLLII